MEENISQLVEEIDNDIVEGFWMKTAAIEAVVKMNQLIGLLLIYS